MALKFCSSFSCLAPSLSPHSQLNRGSQLSLFQARYGSQQNSAQKLRYDRSCTFLNRVQKSSTKIRKSQSVLFAVSEYQLQNNETIPDDSEQENDNHNGDISPASNSNVLFEGTGGKPGLISFYNRPYKRGDKVSVDTSARKNNNLLWLVGPAVLVASFIFPSLYLRKLILTIFEDSLLTDFLILFFTEALFYCGVAVFLLLIDKLRRPTELESAAYSNRILAPQLGQRILSVAALALSLILPMVTMGYVWPWTGPAASATLAPYLVGIVVQFAFEQYARYKKSPSWAAIPVIFQVYRLHQLNRAAQLVTALSFTVKGAEMTSQNLAINSSLGTLLNVLQCLGVICIWSLSSFLMKYFSSTTTTA
ncbi:uncharacterized protein LOC126793776 isoform X2 [Argentina anserina]|uniref:uncharacterized protein LOC126793776 isoform X2 n=1 Tax=Argentina anserina TaxID=57926 RepID=UPI0021762B73|nr:uncharacterized protein LOC126793776 isoform X2 [Potentilla anserina]